MPDYLLNYVMDDDPRQEHEVEFKAEDDDEAVEIGLSKLGDASMVTWFTITDRHGEILRDQW